MLQGDIHRFPDERLGFVAQLRQDHAFGGGEVDQERKPLPDDARAIITASWSAVESVALTRFVIVRASKM